ncbi:MAG: substrate-binding domain-containing protein [Clostridiaceae bacterium]|nr:substrate-binding domain-containing protein [Clostridiaceae bacterium]
MKFETIGKSKQFYDFLKNEILSDDYKPGDKFPSIRELSSKYGISVITVNSVISNLVTEGLLHVVQGKGTFVSEKKNSAKNKKIIGVILFDFSLENNIEATMFNSIQGNLKDNYYVIPYNSYDKLDLFYKGIKGFSELGVDGMILTPPSTEDYDADTVKSLITRDIPVVFINRRVPGIKADFLEMDFDDCVYKAMKHLLDKNKRSIAMVKSNSNTISEAMVRGYKRALNKGGISFDDKFIIEWNENFGKVEKALEGLIGKIDGLVASDYFIYRLRRIIYASGKKVPSDLSIVGINDTAYSRFMNPPLTVLPFTAKQIGEEAIKLIIGKLENKITGEISRSFKTELIIREST